MYGAGHLVMESFLPELFWHIFIPTEGESKINKFNSKILAIEEHDIFQLEITVADVLRMEILEGFDELEEDQFGLMLGELLTLVNNSK